MTVRDEAGRFVKTRPEGAEAPRILFAIRDSINDADRERLRQSGVLVIEVKYLSDVRFMDSAGTEEVIVAASQAGVLGK